MRIRPGIKPEVKQNRTFALPRPSPASLMNILLAGALACGAAYALAFASIGIRIAETLFESPATSVRFAGLYCAGIALGIMIRSLVLKRIPAALRPYLYVILALPAFFYTHTLPLAAAFGYFTYIPALLALSFCEIRAFYAACRPASRAFDKLDLVAFSGGFILLSGMVIGLPLPEEMALFWTILFQLLLAFCIFLCALFLLFSGERAKPEKAVPRHASFDCIYDAWLGIIAGALCGAAILLIGTTYASFLTLAFYPLIPGVLAFCAFTLWGYSRAAALIAVLAGVLCLSLSGWSELNLLTITSLSLYVCAFAVFFAGRFAARHRTLSALCFFLGAGIGFPICTISPFDVAGDISGPQGARSDAAIYDHVTHFPALPDRILKIYYVGQYPPTDPEICKATLKNALLIHWSGPGLYNEPEPKEPGKDCDIHLVRSPDLPDGKTDLAIYDYRSLGYLPARALSEDALTQMQEFAHKTAYPLLITEPDLAHKNLLFRAFQAKIYPRHYAPPPRSRCAPWPDYAPSLGQFLACI